MIARTTISFARSIVVDGSGRVTVHAFLEEGPRKVNVDLAEPEYEFAVKAHGERRLVRCAGQLVKTGQILSLRQPHGFEIVDDE